MGHMNGKDIYRKLGSKLDNMPMRAPWNERLRAILKELYTTEEADLVVRMPFGLSGFDRIQKSLGKGTLQNQLFDNPQSMTHEFMRGFVGGFLKIPPVKKALMSDMLRSSFLKFMERGAIKRRGLDITEI
ncbi:MAG: hypothetical protein AABY87_06945 [bacterium]